MSRTFQQLVSQGTWTEEQRMYRYHSDLGVHNDSQLIHVLDYAQNEKLNSSLSDKTVYDPALFSSRQPSYLYCVLTQLLLLKDIHAGE